MDEVIDIRFLKDQVYILKKYQLTKVEYESVIRDFQYIDLYQRYKQKDEDHVEKTHLPSIAVVFYKHIFEQLTPPSPLALIDEYFDYYAEQIELAASTVIYCGITYQYDAVVGRILRTYPSLIRDFDFYLRLKDKAQNFQVLYSVKEDIEGRDIIIKKNGKEYTLSLFVDTKRSQKFKRIKNLFRHHYDNTEIQVPLKLNNAQQCGDFFLYNESDLVTVLSRLAKL